MSSPFDYCTECYPTSDEFGKISAYNAYDDPKPGCVHGSSREFFQQMELLFPSLEPDSRLAFIIRSRNCNTKSVTKPSSCNLFSFLLLTSWFQDLPVIPRYPPRSKVGSWTIHSANMRGDQYRRWVSTYPASLPDLCHSFTELHGVSPNEGIFVNRNYPLARQWIPCYAPAYFNTVYHGRWPYSCVPVSPSIYTLQNFFEFVGNQPYSNSIESLDESRAEISDVELNRRIDDLELLTQLFYTVELKGSDEAIYLFADISMLLTRYRLELTLRTEHSTSLLLSSYLYAESSAYATISGASCKEPSFSTNFRLAVLRYAKQSTSILRNIPFPVSPEKKTVSEIAYTRCLRGGCIDDCKIDLLLVTHNALIGKLSPNIIWEYISGKQSDRCKNVTESILNCYFVSMFKQ